MKIHVTCQWVTTKVDGDTWREPCVKAFMNEKGLRGRVDVKKMSTGIKSLIPFVTAPCLCEVETDVRNVEILETNSEFTVRRL